MCYSDAPLISWMILAISYNTSKPQIPNLERENNNSAYL